MTQKILWEEVSLRLRSALGARNRQEVADKAGVTKSALDHMLLGKSEPAFGRVAAVAQVLNVDLSDLAYGQPSIGGSALDGMAKGLRRIQAAQRLERPEFIEVPAYDVQASAGPGAINSDIVPSTTIAFRQEWLSRRGAMQEKLAAIRVRGDSMEPTLKNGDLIVVDQDRTNPADGIFVIGFEDEIQVKRLQRLSPTRLVIASDNPLAGSTEIDLRDETQRPRIIGRVIWLGRDL